mgnify:CR=1 FL=1
MGNLFRHLRRNLPRYLLVAGAMLWTGLVAAFGRAIFDWVLKSALSFLGVEVAEVIATIAQYVIPLLLVVGGLGLVWLLIKAERAQQAPSVAPTGTGSADVSVRELLRGLVPYLIDDAPDWRPVLDEVHDKASRGLVTVWGRRMAPAGGISSWIAVGDQEAIAASYWKEGHLALDGISSGNPNLPQTAPLPHRMFTDLERYGSLMVNRAEVLRVWPSRLPAPGGEAKNTVLNALRIVTGAGDEFEVVEQRGAGVNRTVRVKLINAGNGPVTHCSASITGIVPKQEMVPRRISQEGITLNAGEHRWLSVAYQHQAVQGTFGVIGPVGGWGGNILRLPRGTYHVSIEAQGEESKTASVVVVIYADDDGLLRIKPA